MLTHRLKGVNLYLIGMMGAGKTTVGRLLADQIGYRFFDTDALIEQVAGQSIPQLFAESGEAAFRQIETQVLANLSPYYRLAIATGGGIVLDRMNWSYLRHGLVIWLDAPLEVLYQRLQGDQTRPLLQDPNPRDRLHHLLEQRRPLYAQADVHITVTAADTPEQIVQHVLEAIATTLRPEPDPLTEPQQDLRT